MNINDLIKLKRLSNYAKLVKKMFKLIGIKQEEKIKVKGHLTISELKTGKILFEKDNLVVDTGLALLADRLNSDSQSFLTHIAIGSDTTPADPSQTTLVNEFIRNPIGSYSTPGPVFTATTIFLDFEANGVWGEVGLFNDPTAGTMFNRITVSFTKTSAIGVQVQFSVTFSRG
jgi:hypothetical protein